MGLFSKKKPAVGLTITIDGKRGSGKTETARAIRDVLLARGKSVIISDDGEPEVYRLPYSNLERSDTVHIICKQR